MNKRIKQLLTAAILLPLLSNAYAAPGDQGCKPKRGPAPHEMEIGHEAPVPPFLHGVELTEEQQDAIFKIMHADALAVHDRMKASRKAEDALRQLTRSERYDERRAKELSETIADNMAVLTLMRANMEARVYGLLNPEQRKQLDAHEDAQPHPASLQSGRPNPPSRKM